LPTGGGVSLEMRGVGERGQGRERREGKTRWGVGGARELTLTVGPEAWMMDMKSASWSVVLVADSSVVCLGGQEGM